MKLFTAALICVLSLQVRGQYTYFNNGYPPPHPQVGSGGASNILLNGDTTIVYYIAPNDSGIERNHYFISNTGSVVQQYDYELLNNGFLFGQEGDAIIDVNDEYIFATGYYDNQYTKMRGRIISYNLAFEENWNYSLDYYQADSIQRVEYGCVTNLNDGSYFASGWIGIDSIEDVNPWTTHCNFLITKLSSTGDSIWQHEYSFHLDDYFNLPQPFMRSNQVIELPNGELLVWGAWYDQADPFVIKFDSLGNFMQEVHWGHNTLSDWLAWPVQISDHEFMFAYSNALSLYQQSLVIHNIKIGILNTNSMSIDWVGTFDYQHHWGTIVDFEKTPDGGFVALGYGGNPTIENFAGEAYMLKIDSYGNEEWYQTYQPPAAPFFSPQTYDLEVASDGSLIFLGDYEDADAGYYATWLVKTDPCGDEVFNGCPVGVTENGTSKTKSDLLEVYPNPAHDFITVNYHQEMKGLVIRNVLGEIVHEFSLPNNTLQYQLDISDFKSGIYLIEAMVDQGKVAVARWIKN